MDDLLQEFIAETRETLGAIAGEIVAWEADPADRARLDAIFRFVHTVKGSCGFLDLPRLARLSHAAEDVLGAVRSGERVADVALVSAVLAIIDRIGEIVEAIDAGAALDDSAEEALIAALDGSAPLPVLPAVVPSPAASAPRVPARSIRLSVDLLDRMMSGVSDMVLARNELARRLRETGDPALEGTIDRLSLTVADLRETVSRSRMQTIDALFAPLPRVVRDTAAMLGKQVSLTIAGGEVELDREMIELLRDPLVHIVRNAIDHGLETPDQRRLAGKREAGRLAIAARQSGNRIIVEITDDGRGVDTDRLVEKVAARHPERAVALAALDAAARLDLVFEPGLSSREEVTELSGRGVGMDVVRANVAQIGGRIALTNTPGRGLTIAIEVPLTLAIVSAIVVEAGAARFALPRQTVEEIVARDAEVVRIERLGDAQLASVRGRRLPFVALGPLLGCGAGNGAMLVVLNLPAGSFVLAVDRVLDTEELVVKPAAPAVMAAGIYAGQSLPDTGVPLLLLDAAGLAARAGLRFGAAADMREPEVVEAVAADAERALLFVGLDGRQRAIPLVSVNRIETVPTHAVHRAAGRAWVTIDDVLIPLVGDHEASGDSAYRTLLRLQDERGGIAYPVAEAIDAIDLPDDLAAGDGAAVRGIALIAGEAVEVLDPAALLARHAAAPILPSDRPICLLAGAESEWMRAFLRGTIEAAGYRVATRLVPGEEAAVTLAMEGDAVTGDDVVRLRRDARDSRTAVQAALIARSRS